MSAGGKNVYRAALRHSSVRWLTAAFLQSRVGDFMYTVALVAVVFDRTHSAVDVTIAAVLMRVPLVLLPPVAGMLVDRYERRGLMLTLDASRCVIAVGMTALIATKSPVAAVVAGAVLLAALGSAYGPAEVALTAMIVPDEDLAAANAVSASIESLAMIAGPALGALALVVGSPAVAVGIDAATFAVSAACLLRVARDRRPQTSERERGGRLFSGFTSLTKDASLVVVTLALMACCIGVGATNILFLMVSEQRLGTGTHGLGYLLAAGGIGGFLGTLLSNRLAGMRRLAAAVAGLLILTAVAIGLLAVFSSPVPAYLTVGVWGAGYLLLEILAVTLLQRCVAADLLGRATAAVDVLAYAAVMLGAAVTGPVAQHVGVRAAVLAVSSPSLVVAFVIALRARRLDARAVATGSALAPVVAVLADAGVLSGLDRPGLEALAAAAREQVLAPGAVVVRQGEPADDFFVVAAGALDVTSSGGRAGRPTFVRSLGPGDVFGEIGLLERRPRTATVKATETTTLYRVAGADFLRVVTGGDVAQAAIRELAGDRLMRTHPSGLTVARPIG